jgi:type II secretory pathway pseudopilin PulG
MPAKFDKNVFLRYAYESMHPLEKRCSYKSCDASFDKKGFSLIEAMVVMGLSTIISLGVASLMSTMHQGVANVRADVDTTQIALNLNRLANDINSCTGSLQGAFNQAKMPPAPGTPVTSFTLNKLSFYNTTGNPIEDIVGGNAVNIYPEINVSQVIVKNIQRDKTNLNLYYGDLEVDYAAPTLGGPPLKPAVVQTVNFNTTPTGGFDTLTNCSTQTSGQTGNFMFTQWGSKVCPSGTNQLFTGKMVSMMTNVPAGNTGDVMCGQGPLTADAMRQFNGGSGVPAAGPNGFFSMDCAMCAGPSAGGCYTAWGVKSCASGFTLQYSGNINAGGGWSGWNSGQQTCSAVDYPSSYLMMATSSGTWVNGSTGFTPGSFGTVCAVCCR